MLAYPFGSPLASKFAFYGTTSELLRRLIVVYSSQARTSSVLQALNKVEEEAFGNYPETYSKFQKAWDGRRSFCKSHLCKHYVPDHPVLMAS